MNRRLDEVDFCEESDVIIRDIKEDIMFKYIGAFINDNLYDRLEKEAVETVIDYLKEHFDPVDDLSPYVEAAMMYIDIRDIVDEVVNQDIPTREDIWKEIGMSMWDFI